MQNKTKIGIFENFVKTSMYMYMYNVTVGSKSNALTPDQSELNQWEIRL